MNFSVKIVIYCPNNQEYLRLCDFYLGLIDYRMFTELTALLYLKLAEVPVSAGI